MNSDIVFFAFRYSISYHNDLPEVADYILNNWNNIDERDQRIIIKETLNSMITPMIPFDKIDEKRNDYKKWYEVIKLEPTNDKKGDLLFDEQIVYYGFKYCLGRMTYVTSMMSEYLVRNWKRLSEDIQNKILDDIHAADEDDDLGWDCDKESWINVVDSAKVEGGYIEKKATCVKCFPGNTPRENWERTVAKLWDGTKSWCIKCGVGMCFCSKCKKEITKDRYENGSGLCPSCEQDVLNDHCVFD